MVENFDLKKYESGEYNLVTRTGAKARLICHDLSGLRPICCFVSGSVYLYYVDGRCSREYETPNDLLLSKGKYALIEGERYYWITATLTIKFGYYKSNTNDYSTYIEDLNIKGNNKFQNKSKKKLFNW